MNNIRHPLRTPDQRAAVEMQTTIHDVARQVRQMNHSLDELRAQTKSAKEPVLPSKPVVPGEPQPVSPPQDPQIKLLVPVESVPPSAATPGTATEEDGKPRRSPATGVPHNNPPLRGRMEPPQAARNQDEESAPSGQPTEILGRPHPAAPTANPGSGPESPDTDTMPHRQTAAPGLERFTAPATPLAAPPVRSPTALSAGASSATLPAAALPPIPDLRPQLELFVNTVVRNQEQTLILLRETQQLLAAHAKELAALKQQLSEQHNVMGNLRRY